MMDLSRNERLQRDVVAAIQTGAVDELRSLLRAHPGLATATLGDPQTRSAGVSRTLLHVATDWPGHFPRVAETIAALVAAGADVNARVTGKNQETPLHWAASSNDVAALAALVEAGADIEAPGAVIGGGTPLADAVAFGQWQAARRLVELGAQTTLWQAAALGLCDRVEGHFSGAPLPAWSPRSSEISGQAPDEVTHAFWCACHGGQRATAEYLLARGAERNWLGYDNLTPLDAARRSGADDLAEWLASEGAKTAREVK